MFCPNCEKEIQEGQSFCPYCGEKISLESNTPPERTEETDCNAPPSENNEENSEEKTDCNDEEIIAPLYYAERIKETSASTTIVHKKVTQKTKRIILISFFVCIAIGIISIIMHFNSDSYKIEKATDLIIWDKNYDEALRLIQDIDGREAEAVRDYITIVIEKRQALAEGFSQSSLTESGEAVDEFLNALNTFTESKMYHYLPDTLKQQYESTVEYTESITEHLEDIPYYIIDAQTVLLNEPKRKTGESFTLNEMQNNVETSKKALQNLSYATYLSSGVSWDVCGEYTQYFEEKLDDLTTAINEEIESEKEFIKESLDEGFDLSATIYLTYYRENPTEGYSYLPYPLENVYNHDDIYENAWDLFFTVERGMYVYYIANIHVY